MDTVLNQNYFQYDYCFYKPPTGIAMGSPLSSTTAEIYLQYLEEQLIKHWLDSRHILFYRRYVDDKLVIYDQQLTSVDGINYALNQLNPHLSFTYTQKQTTPQLILISQFIDILTTCHWAYTGNPRRLISPFISLSTIRYSIN
jgi:hypothetical protein